jgi:hypothetical protein
VLETSEFSGAYILGFRVENMEEVYTEILNLYKSYSANPVFGVEIAFEDVENNNEQVQVPKVDDNLEIIETGYSTLALPTNKSNYSMGGAGVAKDPL